MFEKNDRKFTRISGISRRRFLNGISTLGVGGLFITRLGGLPMTTESSSEPFTKTSQQEEIQSEINNVDQLKEFLTSDSLTAQPRYPQQALTALNDQRLVDLLQEKFQLGAEAIDVTSLGYNVFTGLNHTLFGLSFPDQDILSGVLVITNSGCEVVAIIPDFNPIQPNPILPPVPVEGAQPFVLNQHSVTEDIQFEDIVMLQGRIRSQAFFEQLGIMTGADGQTKCTTDTTVNTLIGSSCKQLTGLLVPQCDASGPDYEIDTKADQIYDDSGPVCI